MQSLFSDHNGIIIRNRQKHTAHSAHTGNQERFGRLTHSSDACDQRV